MRGRFFKLKLILISSLFVTISQVKANSKTQAEFLNLYGIQQQELKKLSSVSLMKYYSIEKKWDECVAESEKIFLKSKSEYKKIEPWILTEEGYCLIRTSLNKKRYAQLNRWIEKIQKNELLLFVGPWGSALRSVYTEGVMLSAEKGLLFNRKYSLSMINVLYKLDRYLDKNLKARMYSAQAELFFSEQKMSAAKMYFELSLFQVENKEVRSRLLSVNKILNLTQDKAQASSSFGVDDSISNSEDKKTEIVSNDKFYEDIQESIQKKNWLSTISQSVEYMNAFPSSKRSGVLQSRVPDFINSYLAKDVRDNEKKLKALILLESAAVIRLIDWAKGFYKKGDYYSAFVLADKAALRVGISPEQSEIYLLAGRSAHIIGEYEKALTYFSKIIDQAVGSSEYYEALFRSALIKIRLSDLNRARFYLEKHINESPDKNELNVRYYLLRLYEILEPTLAQKEADVILKKYPFSYYGLRLNMEAYQVGGDVSQSKIKNNKYTLVIQQFFRNSKNQKNEKENIESIYLVPDELKNSFSRAEILVKFGWLWEAQVEADTWVLPVGKDSRATEVKLHLARKLYENTSYPLVIRLVNDVLDTDSYRGDFDVLKLGFPDVFESLIKFESEKNKLNPLLTKSLIRQESAFGIRATSVSNAMGLMQLIPPTANEVASELKFKDFAAEIDSYKPHINIQMGTRYISQMIQSHGGNVALGLAAYNAGPYRLANFLNSRSELLSLKAIKDSNWKNEIWLDELPWSETQFYVKAILRNFILNKAFKTVKEEGATSTKVQEQSLAVEFENPIWQELFLGINPEIKK